MPWVQILPWVPACHLPPGGHLWSRSACHLEWVQMGRYYHTCLFVYLLEFLPVLVALCTDSGCLPPLLYTCLPPLPAVSLFTWVGYRCHRSCRSWEAPPPACRCLPATLLCCLHLPGSFTLLPAVLHWVPFCWVSGCTWVGLLLPGTCLPACTQVPGGSAVLPAFWGLPGSLPGSFLYLWILYTVFCLPYGCLRSGYTRYRTCLGSLRRFC